MSDTTKRLTPNSLRGIARSGIPATPTESAGLCALADELDEMRDALKDRDRLDLIERERWSLNYSLTRRDWWMMDIDMRLLGGAHFATAREAMDAAIDALHGIGSLASRRAAHRSAEDTGEAAAIATYLRELANHGMLDRADSEKLVAASEFIARAFPGPAPDGTDREPTP